MYEAYENAGNLINNGKLVYIGEEEQKKENYKNGILNGGAIGGIYLLIIYTISSILNWKFNLNIQSIIMILVGTTFGILGGVIGVNIK